MSLLNPKQHDAETTRTPASVSGTVRETGVSDGGVSKPKDGDNNCPALQGKAEVDISSC